MPGKLAGGIPAGGLACSHPACWQRDTAHAHDAVGVKYMRPAVPLPDKVKAAVRT